MSNPEKLTRIAQLKGKTIARVHLERGTSENTGLSYTDVRYIDFTDGTRLTLAVHETGAEYVVEGTMYPKD